MMRNVKLDCGKLMKELFQERKQMNNLQEIWNDLDEAYEYMERAIEKMSSMPLSKELYERKEKFDLSEISYMKQLVEEMMENIILR